MNQRKEAPREAKAAEIIREILPLAGKRVLDVGCGDGGLTRAMARAGAVATGVDISESRLAEARAKEAVPGADYREGRGEKLPFPDGSVDAVLYHNALHHVPVELQAAALVEAARVLKPGGHVLIIEPLAEGPYFELVRQIEDETEVRRAAYEALRETPAFRQAREEYYDAPVRHADFATYEARSVGIHPSRKDKFEKLRPKMTQNFERLGRRAADGYHFSQPTRVNLLIKSA
jgi:ubiquinone/menaquinone biosynthesis C-methylase UbiE